MNGSRNVAIYCAKSSLLNSTILITRCGGAKMGYQQNGNMFFLAKELISLLQMNLNTHTENNQEYTIIINHTKGEGKKIVRNGDLPTTHKQLW